MLGVLPVRDAMLREHVTRQVELGLEGAASQGPWVDSTSWPYSMARDMTNAIHKKYDLDTLSSNEDVRPLTEEEMQSIRQGLRYPVGVQLSEEDSSRIVEHRKS